MVTLSGGPDVPISGCSAYPGDAFITWVEASRRPRMVALGVGADLVQVIGSCWDKGAAAWVCSGGLGTFAHGHVTQCLPESAFDKCLLND